LSGATESVRSSISPTHRASTMRQLIVLPCCEGKRPRTEPNAKRVALRAEATPRLGIGARSCAAPSRCGVRHDLPTCNVQRSTISWALIRRAAS
jgi:hypothetical protein